MSVIWKEKSHPLPKNKKNTAMIFIFVGVSFLYDKLTNKTVNTCTVH